MFGMAGVANAANTVSFGTIGSGATAVPTASYVELFTPAGSVGSGYVRLNIPGGIPLNTITSLSYNAKVITPGVGPTDGGYAPEVVLNIDTNNSSVLDGTGINWMLSYNPVTLLNNPSTLNGDNFLSGDNTSKSATGADGSFVPRDALIGYTYWAANDARTGFGSFYNSFADILNPLAVSPLLSPLLPVHGITSTSKVYSIDFVVGTSGNFNGMRAQFSSVELNGVTYYVIPPTGSIEITKYACPADSALNRTDNGVGGKPPVGCTLQSGANFGYVHGTQTDAGSPWNEFSAPVTAGGITDSNGVLTISNLAADGRYVVFETDTSNNKLADGDILGLYCVGDADPNPSHNDNGDITFVPAGGTTKCVAYNKLPPPLPVATCPAETTPTLVETKTVDSASSVPTTSSGVLTGGQKYLLVSTGTWQNNNLNVADTEYASVDNWNTFMDGYNIGSYLLGAGEFDLQVNGAFVDWGSYNSAHQYSYLYIGTGAKVNLMVFDGDSNTNTLNPGWYGDNSGSLSVNIYSCLSDVVPPTTGTISGIKYNDLNRDGNQDTGEKGLSGWVIRLISGDKVIAKTTTDSNGNYSFTNIAPGTYEVRETHQKGWKRMSKNPKDIVITAGSVVTDINFGNAVKQKKENEDTDKDDNRDEQSGKYYGNHGKSDYEKDQNNKDHQQQENNFGNNGNHFGNGIGGNFGNPPRR